MVDSHPKTEQWKPAHPGVPMEWRGLGSGGHADVWSDGTVAIKRLRRGAGEEAIKRFGREAQIQSSLEREAGLAVVGVHEIRVREMQTEIVMELMDGSLEDVLGRFAGQPEKAAVALLPIVRTLAALAERTQPIHHRDLKPSNILYRGSEDALFLADFGCAYLGGDERLTPENRAMGAWAYRPPEYSVGRLDHVDEKGDVFSIGKVLWAMVYGRPGRVFPGPVWYEPEYDLAAIHPDAPGINRAMLLVSRSAAVRPEQRPSLREFASALDTLGSRSAEVTTNTAVDALRAEALIEVEHQQRRASAATFIRVIHSDLLTALRNLRSSVPELRLWREWLDEAERTPQTVGALVEQVAEHDSDAPVVNVRFRRIQLVSRLHPSAAGAPLRLTISVQNGDTGAQSAMKVVDADGGPDLLDADWRWNSERRGPLRQAIDPAISGSCEQVGANPIREGSQLPNPDHLCPVAH